MTKSFIKFSLGASALMLGTLLSISSQIAPVSAAEIEVTPFNLVYKSYRGYFADSGIPGYGNFLTAINSGQIKAEDLVEKAIAEGRLAPDTIEDRGYLNSVTGLMHSLEEN